MDIAKVTSKGQVTVPKAVREDLELQTGSKLLFVKTGDGWKIVSPDKSLKARAASRERSDEIRDRVLAEESETYDLDSDKIREAARTKPLGELLDEIRNGFQGVAEASGLETEEDIMAYIKSVRDGVHG